MNRSYTFTAGQSVRRQFPNDDLPHDGEVIDNNPEGIVKIKWTDLAEPTEHTRDEYEYITVI